jgi:hypothetical protein
MYMTPAGSYVYRKIIYNKHYDPSGVEWKPLIAPLWGAATIKKILSINISPLWSSVGLATVIY